MELRISFFIQMENPTLNKKTIHIQDLISNFRSGVLYSQIRDLTQYDILCAIDEF